MFAACVYQTVALCEHPREPKKADRPAIWKLPWFTRVKQAKKMEQTLIWQAKLGAQSAKPTHLGVVAMPTFQADIAQFYKALQILKGRATSGSWRTAAAKEYPPLMNRALAFSQVKEVSRRMQLEPPSTDSTPEVDAKYAQLYRGDADFSEQSIHPDYCPRKLDVDQLD